MANGAVALEPWSTPPATDNCGTPEGKGAEGEEEGAGEGCEAVVKELRRLGHDIKVVRGHARSEMGRAQVRIAENDIIYAYNTAIVLSLERPAVSA